jgi:peptidyl-prolyl cis-trans isomerase C
VPAAPAQAAPLAAQPATPPPAPAPVQQTAAIAPAPASKPAATVNGEIISLAEVDAAAFGNGPPPPQPLTEAQRRQLRLEVLGELIDDLLMSQFLRKNGPKVNPADVDKELQKLEARVKENKPGATLQDFYRETGMTEAQVRANIMKMLQWRDYVTARMSEADLQRYYTENKVFFDKVTVQASHIVLRLPANAPEAERQAARQKLQELRQEILAGKIDFAEAAKKYSQCSSAPRGGDIGYFSRKWMLEEPFAKAAFDLKVGEVSDVVQTEYGLHLIKVTDRKAGQPSEYEKMKDIVKDSYAEELRQSLLAQERKASRIEITVP